MKIVLLVLVCTAQFLCVLDDTIVNVALPSVQRGLGFSDLSLPWVVNGYLVTFGGLLLFAGRAADVFVRRAVFVTGLGVFGASSLACGLAPGPAALVGSRALQGVGAALMSAAALAILTVTFTGAERNRAFGVWGGLSGVAGALGMIIGGALTGWLGWRSVFLINVPVVLAVAGLSRRFVPAGRADRRPRLDLAGALTVTAGLGLFIFAVMHSEQAGWGSAGTVAGLVGAAVLLAVFVAVESRHRAPLLPLGVFRRRNVSGGNACSLLLSSAMLGMFFFLTLYLQRVLGYTALQTGLAYLPMSVTVILVVGPASLVIGRFGFRPALVAGFALIAGALVWFARMDTAGGYLTEVLGPALVAGAGLGTTLVGTITAATHDLGGADEAGLASGLVTTTNQLGGALGLAALSTVAATRVGAPPAEAYRLAFGAAAGFAGAGALIAAFVLTGRSRPRGGDGADVRPTEKSVAGD